jgi:anti-sigma regulatory factor (Ser/Thr protein kinase)
VSEASGEIFGVLADASIPDAPLTERTLERREPPDAFAVVRHWVLDSTSELRTLRAEVAAAIVGRGSATRLRGVPGAVVLVASELATNALCHGLAPTVVTLCRAGQTYLLDVADQAVRVEPVLAERRLPGEGGFGLYLARRLALDVGWYADGETKHVWATFEPSEA